MSAGRPLPKSKRDLWFDELARVGVTDPLAGTVPREFDSDLWWRASAPGAAPSCFFLNVDLDIEATGDLAVFVKALAPAAYMLERPPGLASFELALPVTPQEPEALIVKFVSLVNALPSDARDFWEQAARRTFDVGMQSRRGQTSATYRLSPATLRAVADVAAEVAVTVYGLLPSDEAS